jgi:anti-anti-sigma factor
MGFDIKRDNNWVIFSISDRLDSFNSSDFRAAMDKVISQPGTRLALNLKEANFISIPLIKYFSSVAKEAHQKGGEFALVGTPEKLKRQIDIFATLNSMKIYRSQEDWARHTIR